VARLGFLMSGASIHTGYPRQKLQTLKLSQLFIKFPFICLNDLNFVECRKSNFFIADIHFAAHCVMSLDSDV